MIDLQPVLLDVCAACREGAGGECHVPGCGFWMNRAPDVPLRPVLSRFELIERGALALVNADAVEPHDRADGRWRPAVLAEAVLIAAGVIS